MSGIADSLTAVIFFVLSFKVFEVTVMFQQRPSSFLYLQTVCNLSRRESFFERR